MEKFQDFYSPWLANLFKVYNISKDHETNSLLWDEFNKNVDDPYAFVLFVATEARFMFKSTKKPLTEIVFKEFQQWLKQRKGDLPTKQNKDDAMSFLVNYGSSHLEALKIIFQLEVGNDRGFLAEHLKYVIDPKNDLKEAASIAASLNLQNYISPTELLLPLLAGDKTQVIETYVDTNAQQPHQYASMLNQLCGMTEESLIHYMQSDLGLKIISPTKFKAKTLQKISEKVVKKYQLNPDDYPNIFRDKNLVTLRYLVESKYRAPEAESIKWDDLIESAVAGNERLQEQLIFMMTYHHRDLASAGNFARKFNLPSSVLPARVLSTLEQQSSPTPSKPSTGSKYRLADNDDDDGGGFMFASDDVDEEEEEAFMPVLTPKVVPSKFWDYPLPRENIKFINTCEQLDRCIKVVFKRGNIIGFDGEWQPNYGRAGHGDKMALMQLAVKEEVYLIDMLAFDETQFGRRVLRDLFELLFTSENTLRLGFGIDSDIKVITDSYPYVNELVKISRHFNDLSGVSKQILNLPCVIEKLKIGDQRTQKDRGLSQVVKQCLGKPLDKSYQISNWEKRPLTEEQIRYAALDALCLVKIYDVLDNLTAQLEITVNMRTGRVTMDNDTTSHETQPVELQIASGLCIRPGDLSVVCDTMLQGLGRSLRSFGVDTQILTNGEDHKRAVELYQKQKRIILTRGSPFFKLCSLVPADMCMCVPEGTTEHQVSAVFQRFNVKATSRDIFSRCQLCNGGKYLQVKKEDMMIAYWKKKGFAPKGMNPSQFQAMQVTSSRSDTGIDFRRVTINNGIPLLCEFIPLPVFDKVDVFCCCESCGKVYWEGSHSDKVAGIFSHIIEDGEEEQEIQSEPSSEEDEWQ